MGALRRFVDRAAAVAALVLLMGETGTGKSLVARVIHERSPRARATFMAINCAAVPEALFESELFGHRQGAFTGAHENRAGLIKSSHGGTLLLDEVGDLPLAQQAKLLTVLEQGEVRPVGASTTVKVDVRVVSATARELERGLEQGSFRRDLFHRLALLAVRLPPLRERPGDLPLLAIHLLRAAAARHRLPSPRLDAGTVSLLGAHDWPGNVRELGHALEAALIIGSDLGFEAALRDVLSRAVTPSPQEAGAPPAGDGPPYVSPRYSFYGTDDEERARIRSALSRCRGNRTRAAAELGMSRNTLRDRMRRYGL